MCVCVCVCVCVCARVIDVCLLRVLIVSECSAIVLGVMCMFV